MELAFEPINKSSIQNIQSIDLNDYYLEQEEEQESNNVVNKVYLKSKKQGGELIGYFLFGGEYTELKFVSILPHFNYNFNEEEFEFLLENYCSEKQEKESIIEKVNDFRITTITIVCEIVKFLENEEKKSVYIDLDSVFKYIELDNVLFSVKSFDGYREYELPSMFEYTKEKEKEKYQLKNREKQKTILYNQITLVFYPDFERDFKKSIKNKEKVNMKLFRNGTIQMTGARSFESIKYVKKLFIEKMRKINFKYSLNKVQLKKQNVNYQNLNLEVYVDENQRIYSLGENNQRKKLCGFYQKDHRRKNDEPIIKMFLWVPIYEKYICVKPVCVKCNQRQDFKYCKFVSQDFNDNFERVVFEEGLKFLGIERIKWIDKFENLIKINKKNVIDENQKYEVFETKPLNMKRHKGHFIYYTYEKKRVKWFIDEENECIYDKYTNVVGKISILNNTNVVGKIENNQKENFVSEDESEIGYSIFEPLYLPQKELLKYDIDEDNEKVCMINSIFNIDFKKEKVKIDLFKLKDILINEKGTKCIYDPGSGYIAINIKFYFPGPSFFIKNFKQEKEKQIIQNEILKTNGVCHCSKHMCLYCRHNNKHEEYCLECEKQLGITGDLCIECRECEICKHQQQDCDFEKTSTSSQCEKCICLCNPCDCVCITILSFHSGSNILSGCRSLFQLETVYKWFSNIIQENF